MKLTLPPSGWPEHPERLPMIERVKFLFAVSHYGAEKVGLRSHSRRAELGAYMWHERARIFPEVDPGERAAFEDCTPY